MKKTKKIILIIILMFTLFLSACAQEKTINEIYNVSYTGTVSIDSLESAVQAVIKTSKDGLVGVSNYAYSFGGLDLQSSGSGIIYDAKAVLNDGSVVNASETQDNADNVSYYMYKVVTNQHVIDDAYKIRISFDEETIDIGEEIYQDEEKNLAILAFDSTYYLPTLEFGDSENLVAGAFVIALGCPNGLEYMNSASFGIISYVKRYISERIGMKKVTNEYIQHDAAISPGSSGGPLLNLNGEVIGINSMKVADDETEGMGFAIPSNVVKEFILEYEETQNE